MSSSQGSAGNPEREKPCSSDHATLAVNAETPSLERLVSQLETDQWDRWRKGERVPAEDYLEGHPSLLVEPELVLRLIYGEFTLREKLGEQPTLEEYQRRFPAFAERLALQVKLHQALQEAPAGGGAVATAIFASGELPTTVDRVPSGAGARQTGRAHSTSEPDFPSIPGYEILAELGRGGMGVVYKARHEKLKRLVALKMIRSAIPLDTPERERFRIEAEAIARLQHPNIVQVFDVGEHEGTPFLALELAEGGSLAAHLKGKPVPGNVAADMVETLARAMHHAHLQGIVHRDLKPANILLAGDARPGEPEVAGSSLLRATPKITDFGLAKQLDAEVGCTVSGEVMGTPSYMSPEQATGRTRAIGPLADVYSLGAILYELLTGRPPFVGTSILDTLEQVRNVEPVRPSRLLFLLPRDLETICLKCLEKEPARRYPSALELADDLRRFRDGKPIVARPATRFERGVKWMRRHPAATVAMAVLALAVIVVGWQIADKVAAQGRENLALAGKADALQKKADADLRALQAKAERDKAEERAQRGRRDSYFLQIAQADRQWNANLVDQFEPLLDACDSDLRGWEWHLLKRRAHASLQSITTNATPLNRVACSPDGRWLALGSGATGTVGRGTVTIVNLAAGRSEYTLTDPEAAVTHVEFSGDGQRLATASYQYDLPSVAKGDLRPFEHLRGAIRIWDIETHKLLWTSTEGYGSVSLSRDGKRLAASGKRNLAIVWEAGPDGWREATRLPEFRGLVNSVVLSPDGKHVAVSWIKFLAVQAGNVQTESALELWNATTGKRDHVLLGHTRAAEDLAFSPDGKVLASSASDATVRLWDVTSGKQHQLMRGHAGSIRSVAFNRDGQRLATVSQDGVRVWETTSGRELLRLHRSHGAGPAASAAFVPRTMSVPERLLVADKDGQLRLWDAEAGDGPISLQDARLVLALAFSPSGQNIASCSRLDGSVRIWDVASRKERQRLQALAEHVAFSPDGRWLASAGGARPDQPGELKIWNAVGKSERILAGHTLFVTALAFSPDSRFLATADGNPVHVPPRPGKIRIWECETGKLVHSFDPGLGMVSALCYSSDGERLAIGGDRPEILICLPSTGREYQKLVGHGRTVRTVAYGPNGLLASGDADGNVLIWNADSGTLRQRLQPAHLGAVSALSFHPEGRRLASVNSNFWAHPKTRQMVSVPAEVKIWDLETGREAFVLPGQHGVAFGAQGRYLATIQRSADPLAPGVIDVWDARPIER